MSESLNKIISGKIEHLFNWWKKLKDEKIIQILMVEKQRIESILSLINVL
jgi:hypothetical protein